MTSLAATFEDADLLAEALARVIAEAHGAAVGGFVLGCPSGRSARLTYRAFGRLAAARGLDLSATHVVMMDEYVVADGGGWRWCDPDQHFSCRGYAEREIRAAWNAGLPAARQLPAAHVHTPDPRDPEAFEALIEGLGGIDLFLLASGARDGHVAFNPPGTRAWARTRVVELAPETRLDNMDTFPGFASLAEVPTHGVTVGPGTIRRWSKAAVMILTGAAKAAAYARIVAASGYDADWPATVIQVCANARIFADRDAAAGALQPEPDRCEP